MVRAMSDLPRMAALPPGPFARLATLLGDVKPGKDPISLSIGDPSGRCRISCKEALAKGAAGFGNYPAIIGTRGLAPGSGGMAEPPLRPERRDRRRKDMSCR